MMGFKTSSLIVLLIISIFLLSSCEVYQTLYGAGAAPESGNESAVDEAVDNQTAMEETLDEMEVPEKTELSDDELIEEEAEIVAVKSEEKPVVIVVRETDLVDLIPKAQDPDNDKLLFSFTSPLNDLGGWQTTYGDAGEYTITITVSDGQAATSRDVLIIVNKKEESPKIDASKPIESGLTILETESVDFYVEASDLNNDPLTFAWKLDGVLIGEFSDFTYQTDYDSAGTHTVKADVTDGISTASRIWSIEVTNVNRKPVLDQIGDVYVRETEKVIITAFATDDDLDPITYSISDKRFMQTENVFTWQTDYDSAGTYKVTVRSMDGADTTEEAFTVNVENVNRPPVITDVLQK
jgi:hypothetical protein